MKLRRWQFPCMGCPCEIGVYSNSAALAKRAIEDAANEVRRLDDKYSHFQADSYITQLQIKARQPAGTRVDMETAALLDYSARQYELSNGLFDITSGALTRLWHQRCSLPSTAEIAAALQLTGWSKVRWRSPVLHIPAGMQLELGGVAKEYAADRAALILKQHGLQSAFVELGGDIHVCGPQADEQPWNMGIRNPAYGHQQVQKRSRTGLRKSRDQAMANIPVRAGGLATSGDYERVSLIGGKPYGHIINPLNGWPIESFQSVSVLAPSCLLAGSISTLAMLLGEHDGLAMLRDSGLTWLVQSADGVIRSASF